MTEYAYNPDPKPPAPSFDHMQTILDKHAKRLGAGQSPQAQSDDKQTDGRDQPQTPGMAWSEPQKGLGFVYIDSGPYRITRHNKKYECHRECYYLGTRDNAEDAKQFCAAHLAAQAQTQQVN